MNKQESKQPTFGSFVISVTLNSAAIAGMYSESIMAQNAALGLVWFLIAMTPLMLVVLSKDERMAALRVKLGSRPRYRVRIGRFFDFAIGVSLAAVGWWWTFGFYIFHAVISLALEQASEDESRKQSQDG